ncbi:chromate efflux transporter [Chryseobacterium sp. RRHN12]|uniref:chromate efflux transporter n=1 Tax=Chryseobacterium sp. RRHN12 TaxID=3437884 RepID=UPI003D9B83E2
MNNNNDLKDLAKLFLKLGIIGFGGPAAHIAMMQKEVVTEKKWLTDQEFLDLIGATNLIPGPNSTEMAIHIGREKAGWKGLIVAGLCFILPAVIITAAFAWLYKEYGLLPEVQPFIYGIKPAIIAIILGAVFPLAKKSVKTFRLAVIGGMVLTCSLLKINEIGLMFGAGLLTLTIDYLQKNNFKKLNNIIFIGPLQFLLSDTYSLLNLKLFWIFLKIGAILYGSGYVLFAFLDTELVSRGIITRQELIDAIAVGQFTPGPVFSSVTFVGYQINGLSGALVSTLAIFLPSFILVAVSGPFVNKMRNSATFSSFLNGVNVASIAIIMSVCITMGIDSITDWKTTLITCISTAVVFGLKKLNSAFVVIGGALLGFLLSFLS